VERRVTEPALAAAPAVAPAAIAFPSVAWFQRLADLMNANRARQEQLGYVDCIAEFAVTDGGDSGGRFAVQVTFGEFAATDVRTADPGHPGHADFMLEAPLAVWRAMIASIAAGHGRPGLEHTLNRLSHLGTPMRVVSDDPLRRDLFFRYNQSLQEFVNASAAFPTRFPS
jgi:hypothetical protein